MGKITSLRGELEIARLQEQDEGKPSIVFVGDKSPYVQNKGDWIFEKKTAKRIYIRRRGGTRTIYYNLDGSAVNTYDGSIDLEASGIK